MKGVGFYESDFLKIKEQKELIAESIKRILMTVPGERVGRPEFGCDLRRLLFESTEDISLSRVKEIVETAISIFEPRIVVQDVNVSAYENTIYIKIKFQMVGNPLDTEELTYTFNIGE